MAATAKQFRTTFRVVKERINWYPGHMNQSLKHMQALMRKIDCVVEVHDSRIPFTGRNHKFLGSLIGPKPHILVLNKKDLINKKYFDAIEEKYKEIGISNVVFTNCLDQKCKGLNRIIFLAADLIQGYISSQKLDSSHRIMVVGVPNVGKSSLINALRNLNYAKGKASKVGAEAGITRAVQNEVKVFSSPPIYLVDTPGILTPNIDDVECGMKLALCACLKDNVVGINIIADFVLYWMNKTGNYKYMSMFGLKEPSDDILPLLVKIAVDNKYIRKIKNIVSNKIEEVPDLDSAACLIVSLFRKGKLGDLCLDKNYLNGVS